MNTLLVIATVLYFWGVLGIIPAYAYGQNVFNKNWNKFQCLILVW